eukprot:322280_1
MQAQNFDFPLSSQSTQMAANYVETANLNEDNELMVRLGSNVAQLNLEIDSANNGNVSNKTIQIVQIHDTLTNYGYSGEQINHALDQIGSLSKHSNLQHIIADLTDIIHQQGNNSDDNHGNDDMEDHKQFMPTVMPTAMPTVYDIKYEKDDWIEICDDSGKWHPGVITKTVQLKNNNKGFDRNKILTVQYQDSKTSQDKQITLNGIKDKNRIRVLGSDAFSNHRFRFEYANNNDKKQNDPNNAKHPGFYINRPCFRCDGKGIRKSNSSQCQNCKGTGTASLPCNKCDASGTFKAFSVLHKYCNGYGCKGCDGSGRYPSKDLPCRACNGGGIFRPKCNQCDGKRRNLRRDNNCKNCIKGLYLAPMKPFNPTRDHHKTFGQNNRQNMKRLYHATDDKGARGIKEMGVMCRGSDGSYGGGIYFSEDAQSCRDRARHKGWFVIADVFIGKCKDEHTVNTDLNFTKLHSMGYDSIRGYWSEGSLEYVVYNWDQVWVHVVVPFAEIRDLIKTLNNRRK